MILGCKEELVSLFVSQKQRESSLDYISSRILVLEMHHSHNEALKGLVLMKRSFSKSWKELLDKICCPLNFGEAYKAFRNFRKHNTIWNDEFAQSIVSLLDAIMTAAVDFLHFCFCFYTNDSSRPPKHLKHLDHNVGDVYDKYIPHYVLNVGPSSQIYYVGLRFIFQL